MTRHGARCLSNKPNLGVDLWFGGSKLEISSENAQVESLNLTFSKFPLDRNQETLFNFFNHVCHYCSSSVDEDIVSCFKDGLPSIEPIFHHPNIRLSSSIERSFSSTMQSYPIEHLDQFKNLCSSYTYYRS
jgi:hypothetical protein